MFTVLIFILSSKMKGKSQTLCLYPCPPIGLMKYSGSEYRICGDTALDKNIHESVSAQIKKNFAKSKWKVSQQPAEHAVHFCCSSPGFALRHQQQLALIYFFAHPFTVQESNRNAKKLAFFLFLLFWLQLPCYTTVSLCGCWFHK